MSFMLDLPRISILVPYWHLQSRLGRCSFSVSLAVVILLDAFPPLLDTSQPSLTLPTPLPLDTVHFLTTYIIPTPKIHPPKLQKDITSQRHLLPGGANAS